MNGSGYLCLLFMVGVGGLAFPIYPEAAAYSSGLIACFSVGYFLFFIFKNKLHLEIIAGVLLSMVVMAIGLIPVIGWIVVICFVLYNIGRALEGLKSLLPDVLASAFIYGLLGAKFVFNIHDPAALVCLAMIYLVAAIMYCRRLSKFSAEGALFKMCIMWLSIPLAVLTIISIFSSLGNLFRTIGSTLSRTVVTPQIVSAHLRGGIQIDAYTRNISSTVTETVTRTVPSVGVVTSAVAGEVAQKVKEKKDNKRAMASGRDERQ